MIDVPWLHVRRDDDGGHAWTKPGEVECRGRTAYAVRRDAPFGQRMIVQTSVFIIDNDENTAFPDLVVSAQIVVNGPDQLLAIGYVMIRRVLVIRRQRNAITLL